MPKVPGGFLDPDVESIIALEPDLVIGLASSHDGLAAALEGTAPLWITESNSIEDSIHYLRDLGALTGRGEQAVAAETAFRDKLAGATVDRDTTALVVFGADSTFEIGTGGYLGELLGRLYNFPWQQTGQFVGSSPCSVEEIAATGADVIFTLNYNSDPATLSFATTLAQDPLWQQVAAVHVRRPAAPAADRADRGGVSRGVRTAAAGGAAQPARVPGDYRRRVRSGDRTVGRQDRTHRAGEHRARRDLGRVGRRGPVVDGGGAGTATGDKGAAPTRSLVSTVAR